MANDEYSNPKNCLKYSVENGRELEKLLKSIDFEVTTYINIDRNAISKLKDFTSKIQDGDLVLLYYCGHGHQVNGTNYLIPSDDERIAQDVDVQDVGIQIKSILLNVNEKTKSTGNIFVFDCARPYYFKDLNLSNCKFN